MSDTARGKTRTLAPTLSGREVSGRSGFLASVVADYGAWLVECRRDDEAEPMLDEAQGLFEQEGAQRWLDRIAAVHPTAEVTA